MNILELSRKRCSVRQYLPAPVEEDKLSYILEVARMSPSACNFQPWYFLIVTEEEGRKKLYESYPRKWIEPVALFIVLCGDRKLSWKRPSDGKDHLDVDAGIVTEHICLAAAELGLGSCIVCHFNAPLLHASFNLPEPVEPLVIIPIGYPSDPDLFARTPKNRKPAGEMIRKERF